MILYLEKRGCDFRKGDERTTESDLQNYRLFLEFIARDGRRICGDIILGDVRQPFTNSRGQTDYKTISFNGLYTDFQYENRTGCYVYTIDAGFTPHFTQADALKLINSASAVQYDGVEIVQELPAAAHDYPESARALERAFLERDRAALVAETEQKIRDNFMTWFSGLRWAFQQMTPDEYKRMTLLAFDLMAERYGVIEQEPESRITPACLVAHRMSRHFFEEQNHVDPFADAAFLKALEERSPYYVGRCLRALTPQQPAEAVEG